MLLPAGNGHGPRADVRRQLFQAAGVHWTTSHGRSGFSPSEPTMLAVLRCLYAAGVLHDLPQPSAGSTDKEYQSAVQAWASTQLARPPLNEEQVAAVDAYAKSLPVVAVPSDIDTAPLDGPVSDVDEVTIDELMEHTCGHCTRPLLDCLCLPVSYRCVLLEWMSGCSPFCH
jgi:hypothetical protein